jgi:hypothetical protein
MSKRFNYYDRKKLFEARESGLSDTELKRRFGIKDNRTLRRHLKLAEQEERALLVNLEFLKDAKANHLAEIRTLIEQWQVTLVTPQIHEVHPGTSSPIHGVEADPLYGSLREHLPFPTLWRDYSLFRSKISQYLETCKELRVGIRECWKFQDTELAPSFEEPILRLVAGRDTLRYELYIVVGNELKEFKYQVLVVNGTEVVWGRESRVQKFKVLNHEQCSKEALPAEYQKVADSIYETGASQAKQLFQALKELEAKLHESLQEIQLRHDYIMYTCKLCPGQPRLSR